MAYFPVLIDWTDVPVLVAGGGQIALHKAELLSGYGAKVTVVAREACDELHSLQVTLLERDVTGEDAEDKALVVDATGSAEAEAVLSAVCKARGIPYNCTGHGSACTAIFPAVHRSGRTMVAVSSIGASPAASAWLRDRLAGQVPEEMDEILDAMADLRPVSRKLFSEQPVRRIFLHRCLDLMLREKRSITEEEREEIARTLAEEQEI